MPRRKRDEMDEEGRGETKDEDEMDGTTDKKAKRSTAVVRTSLAWNLSIRHAWDETSGSPAWAIDALRHHRFHCPDCEQRVILKRGVQRAAHFAHFASQDEEDCSRYRSPTMGESLLHREAKLLLAEWLRRRNRLWLVRDCPCCFRPKRDECALEETDDQVDTEYRGRDARTGDRYVADLAIVDRAGHVRTIVEIRHTHATKDFRPEPWHEVSAEQTCRVLIENWTSVVPALVQLNDIREYSGLTSCGHELCQCMSRLASELGYLEFKPISDNWYEDPLAYIAHTMRGKIEQVAEWRRQPTRSSAPYLWTEFLRRQRCMRCLHRCIEVKSFRPFCMSCFRTIQKRRSVPVSLETKLIEWSELRERKRHLAPLERLPSSTSSSSWSECAACHVDTSRWLFYFGYRPVCLAVPCLRQAVEGKVVICESSLPLRKAARESKHDNDEGSFVRESKHDNDEGPSVRESKHDNDECPSLPVVVVVHPQRKRSILSPHFPIRSEHQVNRLLLRLLSLPKGVLSFLGRSRPSLVSFIDLVADTP